MDERILKSMEEEMKLAKLNALYGAWSGDDGERIEAAVKDARNADYERELISMDERDDG